jgi:hypothetical protein
MIAVASGLERNHSMLKHTSRSLPLKLSSVPFCHGLPGSMCAVSTCARRQPAQDRSRDELRPVVGAQAPGRAVHADQPRQHLDHPARPDAARHVDGEHLARPLVHDREALEPLPVGAGVEDEVVRPDLVASRRHERPGPSGGHAAPRPPSRHLQLALAPEPVSAIVAHAVAVAAEEDPDPAVAVPRVVRCQLAHAGSHRGIGLLLAGFVVQGRARDAQELAGAAAGESPPLRVLHLQPPSGRAHHFFAVISLSTSSSRSRSATIFFSRPFSVSSALSFLVSVALIVPKRFRQT